MIDGPDGAGKSTQIERLARAIEAAGVEVSCLRDPGGTHIGEQIRAILLDRANKGMAVRCETLLYMASRAQLWEERIRPALGEGRCVLCDRWLSSTYAYQAVAGKIGREVLLDMAEAALERTWPDLIVIVDVDSEEGLKRVGVRGGGVQAGQVLDRMEEKGSAFHKRVREAFLELAERRPDEVKVIDGGGDIEAVQGALKGVIEAYVAG